MALIKRKTGKDDLDARERKDVLHTLANICTTMMRDKRGVVGDVARAKGGSLVAPPIDPRHLRRYFGDLKGFGAVDELVTIFTVGVPVNAAATGVNLERALHYGNHRIATEHLPAVWKNRGRHTTSEMLSDTEINRARTPKSTYHRLRPS